MRETAKVQLLDAICESIINVYFFVRLLLDARTGRPKRLFFFNLSGSNLSDTLPLAASSKNSFVYPKWEQIHSRNDLINWLYRCFGLIFLVFVKKKKLNAILKSYNHPLASQDDSSPVFNRKTFRFKEKSCSANTWNKFPFKKTVFE